MKKYLFAAFILIPEFIFAGIKFQGTNASLNFDKTNSSLALENNITGFNGKLKLRTAASDNIKTTSSRTIGFSGGSIQVDNNVIDLTGGTYDPKAAGTDEVILQNGNILSVSAGSAVGHVVSVASSATASIIGTPNFSSAVVVGDSATLNLGLRHKLSQNITLGANSIMVLTDDLSLADGIKFDGTGVSGGTAVVDLTKHSLEIGSSGATSAWTGTINFKRAQDIAINGPISLSGTWNFVTDGTDKQSVLNGNGNVLDLAGGGTIQVGSDHTLFISDLTIKSFGTGAGTFNLANSATTPGTVVLSNVTLELSANYTHAAGLIIVRGDNVRVIVGKSAGGAPYTFTLDVLNSAASTEIETLNIDGQVLIYETLGGDNTMPFMKLLGSGAGQGALSLSATGTEVATNGGVIRSAISTVVSTDTVIDAVANNGSTVTLTNNYNLFTNVASPGSTPTGRIVVTNTAAPTAKTVTIDGSNYFWQFPGGTYDVLKIAEGVTVTLQNVVLRDFSLDNVEFVHASTSVLKFGDGVVISLGRDNDLPISTRGLTFSGNATIQGNGRTLRLTSASNIVQSGASKTLTISNTKLKLENSTALACTDSTAKIKLSGSRLLINQAGWTIGTGSLDIGGKVYLDSSVSNAVDGQSLIDFTTTGTLTVDSASTLVLGRNINFQYRPNPTNNANTRTPVYFSRRHLVLTDKTSTLLVNGCTITSTATAFSLDYGNLLVDNGTYLNIASGAGHDVEVAELVNLEILGAGKFVVDGQLSYTMVHTTPYSVGLVTMNLPSLSTTANLMPYFNNATSRRFALFGFSVTPGTGTVAEWPNRNPHHARKIAFTLGSMSGRNALVMCRPTELSYTLALNNSSDTSLSDAGYWYNLNLSNYHQIDVGTEGRVVTLKNGVGIYLENSAGGTAYTFLGLSDAVFLTMGNVSNIFAMKANGTVWKYASGTTWNQITIGSGKLVRHIAAGTDGTLWFIDEYGDLWKRDSGGTLSFDMASHNLNLVKLSAKGTSSNYRIAAVDIDGKLYTAKPWQSLTYSSINGVSECGVASNGMLAFSFPTEQEVLYETSFSSGRVYAGWVPGDEPVGWPY